MSLKRTAVVAFIAGTGIKASLIIIWKLSTVPILGLLLTKYDPAAFYLAEGVTRLFFDQKRLFPGSQEGLFFEAVLAIAFGIECMVLGLMVWWLLQRLRNRRIAATEPPPSVQ